MLVITADMIRYFIEWNTCTCWLWECEYVCTAHTSTYKWMYVSYGRTLPVSLSVSYASEQHRLHIAYWSMMVKGVKGSVWAESTCGPTRGVYTKPLLHSSLTLVRVHVWIKPIEGTTLSQAVAWGADTGFISWQELVKKKLEVDEV